MAMQVGDCFARRGAVEHRRDEMRCDGALGVGEQREQVVLFDRLAVAHDEHAVGDALDHVHLMRDEHDGDVQLAVDATQQVEHILRGLGVEGARRLVGEKYARMRGERASDADTLLLPAGKLAGILVRVLGEPHEFKQLGDSAVAIVRTPVVAHQRVGDVAGDRAGFKKVELLEHHADFLTDGAQLAFAQVRDVLPHDFHGATRGAFQRVDHAHQRGFASAGVSDDAEDFSFGDVDAHVIDRFGQRLALFCCLARSARIGEDLGDVAEPDYCLVRLLHAGIGRRPLRLR